MSEQVLHCGCKLCCPHGGEVKIDKPSRTWWIGDEPVLTVEDIEGATISNCSLSPPFVKCTKVLKVLTGKAEALRSDGLTPVLSTLLFLTNGGPPGIGRPAGGESIAETLSPGTVQFGSPSEQSPADVEKPGGQVKRLRLRLSGLPAGATGATVIVAAGQGARVEFQSVAVPLGGVAELTLGLDPNREAWAVVTSHPLDNAIDQIEVNGVVPRLVVGRKQSIPLLPEFAKAGVASYSDLRKFSPGISIKLLHALNGLPSDCKILPPDGGVLRPAVRLPPEPTTNLDLAPGYPALLSLATTLSTVEQALEEPLDLIKRARIVERILLARFCAELTNEQPKYFDAFATTSTAHTAPFVHNALLSHHARCRTRWESRLRGPALDTRNQFAERALWENYERFVSTSPFFLGTRDVKQTVPNTEDALLELYVQGTCENAGLRLLRNGIRLLGESAELFALLRQLAGEQEDDPDGWQPIITNVIEKWNFSGTNGSERKPIFGCALLSKIAWYLGKKALGKPDVIAVWVSETVTSTLLWVAPFDKTGKTPSRVLDQFPEIRPKEQRRQAATAARRVARESLPGMQRAFAALFVLNTVEKARAAVDRKWSQEDAYGFTIDLLKTVSSALDLASKGAEYYAALDKTAVMTKYGKTTGGARTSLLKIDALSKKATKVGNALAVFDAVVDIMEAAPEFKRGDTNRATLRLAAAGLGLGALAVTGFWPALAIFVAGAVLDAMIACLELSEEERELRNILRDTEFGVQGYPRSIGSSISAVSPDEMLPLHLEPPFLTPENIRRQKPPEAVLYESGAPLAPCSPSAFRDQLLGLPWRAFPALLPLSPDAPQRYVEGVVVRLMPLPALSPVSYARLPGGLLLRQETRLGLESLPTVTLTLSPANGPSEPICHIRHSDCLKNHGIGKDLPSPSASGKILLLVPDSFTKRMTIIHDIVIPGTKALYLVFGPHEFGQREPDMGGCFDPTIVRTGTKDELRALASRGQLLEVLLRNPELQVVLAKSAPERTIVRIDMPAQPDGNWILTTKEIG